VSEPFWLADAASACPDQAAEYYRLQMALQLLPVNASTNDFLDLYEQMLDARDRLYDAWISMEMES